MTLHFWFLRMVKSQCGNSRRDRCLFKVTQYDWEASSWAESYAVLTFTRVIGLRVGRDCLLMIWDGDGRHLTCVYPTWQLFVVQLAMIIPCKLDSVLSIGSHFSKKNILYKSMNIHSFVGKMEEVNHLTYNVFFNYLFGINKQQQTNKLLEVLEMTNFRFS